MRILKYAVKPHDEEPGLLQGKIVIDTITFKMQFFFLCSSLHSFYPGCQRLF